MIEFVLYLVFQFIFFLFYNLSLCAYVRPSCYEAQSAIGFRFAAAVSSGLTVASKFLVLAVTYVWPAISPIPLDLNAIEFIVPVSYTHLTLPTIYSV